MIASPDVMHAAFALDQELVDIGRGPSDMRVRWARIAFLMAAHAHAAAAGTPDVAGGQRHVHKRAVGAVVVVAPDEALLIGKHGSPACIAFLRLGNPFRRLADLVGGEAGDAGRFVEADIVGRACLIEVFGRSVDEGLIRPALARNVG